MQKKLIAVAVVAALTAPLSSQAEMKIYGRAHVSVDQLDDGTDSGTNVSSNSSRIGFKADKELENGMTALFQAEQEIRYDNGSGADWASRDSFVGLKGDFGMVRLGYFDTPLKIVRGRADLFGDQIGDARNMTRLREFGADFDTRFRNGIHYRTPSMNGLTGDVHYSTNNNSNTNPPADDTDALSLGVNYRSDDMYLGLAHEQRESDDFSAVRLGAYYDFGDFRVTGLGQWADLKASGDVDTYGLGLRYKMGKTALKGQYYWVDTDGTDTDANMMAIGVDYSLDKSTKVYVAYARTDNDDNADFSMAGGGHGAQITPTVGETISGFSVGLLYNF
jgi:predicted porin